MILGTRVDWKCRPRYHLRLFSNDNDGHDGSPLTLLKVISFIDFIFIVVGATGLDWHIHARQDPHAKDLADPDLQGSLVAEGARIHRHGLVSSKYPGTNALPHRNTPQYPTVFTVMSLKYYSY